MSAVAIEALLTEGEAAGLLGISERTLRDIRRNGEIRYVAVSKRIIRYRIEDCREYIEAHVRAESPPQARPGRQRVKRPSGNVVRFSQRGR